MSKGYTEVLKRRAISAIEDIFGDTTVSRETTKQCLEEILDTLESLIATLED